MNPLNVHQSEMGETIATAACGCIHLIRSVGCLARSIAKMHVLVGLLRVAVFLKYKKSIIQSLKVFLACQKPCGEF